MGCRRRRTGPGSHEIPRRRGRTGLVRDDQTDLGGGPAGPADAVTDRQLSIPLTRTRRGPTHAADRRRPEPTGIELTLHRPARPARAARPPSTVIVASGTSARLHE